MSPSTAKKPTGTALMLIDDVVDNLPFIVRRDLHRRGIRQKKRTPPAAGERPTTATTMTPT